MKMTQFVQVPDVQLVTLNVVIEVLNDHRHNTQPFYSHITSTCLSQHSQKELDDFVAAKIHFLFALADVN